MTDEGKGNSPMLGKLLFGSAARVNKKGTECRGLYLLVENMEKVEKRKCVLFFDNRAKT